MIFIISFLCFFEGLRPTNFWKEGDGAKQEHKIGRNDGD